MPGSSDGSRSSRPPAEAAPDLGPCPVCGRRLIAGPSVDRHHFLPRSEGGREATEVHRLCHRKIHSLWTERELAAGLATPEAVRAHPAMRPFLNWARRKHPEYTARTATARSKRRR